MVVVLLANGDGFIEVTDVQAELLWRNVAVAEDEQGAKDGLGDDIENAVEDGLAIGMDDVTTFTEAPGNGVEEPDLAYTLMRSVRRRLVWTTYKDQNNATHIVCARRIWAQCRCILAASEYERVDDI